MSRVLLLSGGLDSTSVAAWQRPEYCLGIDYGQRAAAAEKQAAEAVASHLGLDFSHVSVDAAAIGGGLMARNNPCQDGRAPEWWPFRNQLLITVAAAWAVVRQIDEVLVGSVSGDGDRHADGRREFYDAMTTVLRLQEGSVSVSAPAIELSAATLIKVSGVDDAALAWTHSCHVADLPCQHCPGCLKRSEVLAEAGRLRG